MGVAQNIYARFLQEVVVAKVFGDAERERGGVRLDAAQHTEITQGKRIDTRSPFLTRRSGKGGWSADPDRAKVYARFINVSLLDHLCSVVRGAVQMAEIDLLASPERPDGDELSQRLAMIAVIAFLHDADKILELPRSEHLQPAQIADLMARYGLDDFLERHAKPLSGAEMLALIEQVEATQAGRLQAVPRAARHDCTYVRLADRLDSRFLRLQPDPERPNDKIGLDAVLGELTHYDALATDVMRRWRPIELRDPHTPFLLDALQACLSEACRAHHGHPPLIELHHDGRLLVLIPEDGADTVIKEALAEVTGQLGATIRVHTTTRGTMDLLDAPGSIADLRRSVENMLATNREKILRIGRDVVGVHGADVDALLGQVNFLPVFPDLAKFPDMRLVPLWSGTATLDDTVRATHSDAALVNAVLSCEDPPAKLGIPDAARRETELRCLLDKFGLLPASSAWLSGIPNASRYALLAALAAGAAANNPDVAGELTGSDGVVALWLEGRDGRKGLVAKIDSSGTRLAEAVAVHYRTLLAHQLVTAPDEAAEGRCHFTNAPVPRSARIDGSTGLYGVNVSAFSGREGRPETYRSVQAETLVSPLAEAEHRLRAMEYERGGRSPVGRDVPVRVTSPTSAGLFGALAYQKGNDPREYAFSDVLRTTIGKGLTYRAQDGLDRRVRVARYEEMPTRLVANGTEPGQIGFVSMAFEAAQRLGRPIHVFRGLPRVRPEFVFFDTLPQPIELLLGGTGARLEQLPGLIDRLRGVEAIADATGFGAELAARLCDPMTRFGAACDALARAENRLTKQADPTLRRIQTFSRKLLGDPDTMPSISDRAIVAFGEAMALVQRIPLRSDGGNVSELGLRIALDTAETLERMGQIHDDSLTFGVAGEITELLSRRSLVARGEIRNGRALAEVVEAAAHQFVAGVWHGAFGGAVPSSRNRRIALATYRFSFERSARARWAALGQLHVPDEAVS
jgi:hypothetical protein